MPLKFKIPGYAGNGLLLLLGVIGALNASNTGGIVLAALIGAVAVLNLYLVYKLDMFSRDENWLAAEVVKARLRAELRAAQQREDLPE